MDGFFSIFELEIKCITNRVVREDVGENSFATPDWHLLRLLLQPLRRFEPLQGLDELPMDTVEDHPAL
jgi:hypothetical protein